MRFNCINDIIKLGGEVLSISENLKRLRKQRNLTQKQLAKACDLSIATIQGYEQGKYEPKPEALIKLSIALQAKPSEIMDYERSFIKPKNSLVSLFAGQPTNIAQRGLDVLEPLKENLVESAELAVIQGKDLLDSISRLNEEGQQKVKEYADDLAENPRYQRADAPDPEE